MEGRIAMKRSLLAALATLALVLGLSGPAAAANAKPVCPPGYFEGTITLDQALVHYAGFYTEEEIRAGFAGHDRNGNGLVCRKQPPPFKDKFFPLYLLIDDLARGSA
jgi:hypothetical protein